MPLRQCHCAESGEQFILPARGIFEWLWAEKMFELNPLLVYDLIFFEKTNKPLSISATKRNKKLSWSSRPNPEDQINRKPEDRIFNHKSE